MKKTCLKCQKKWIIIPCIFICIGVGIYILLPRIDSILFRKKVGTLNEWREMCNKEETSFLNYDIPDSGEQGKDKFYHPDKEASVFSFDGVVKIDDGLYITGIRGLTDWGMMIRIYSRKNMILETPQEISGEYKIWDFYLTCKGAEHSDFPYQENLEMAVANKQFAYSVTTYLVAPDKIGEDGEITLLYHSGKYYKQEKEVKIYVEYEKVTE